MLCHLLGVYRVKFANFGKYNFLSFTLALAPRSKIIFRPPLFLVRKAEKVLLHLPFFVKNFFAKNAIFAENGPIYLCKYIYRQTNWKKCQMVLALEHLALTIAADLEDLTSKKQYLANVWFNKNVSYRKKIQSEIVQISG